MYKEIKHLRRKFFVLSASIAFVIIFVMLFALNLLMHISYENEFETASDMLEQTAYSNADSVHYELIDLSNTLTNSNGDHIIFRDIRQIQSVVINGELTCADRSAEWYCAGGGLFFEYTDNSGSMKFVNKEYKFNRGNDKITVDLTDNTDFLIDGNPVNVDISDLSGDKFYLSDVWWAMSDRSENTTDPDVELNLKSIEIQYKENTSVAASKNYQVSSRSFSDIYPSGVPQTLNNFSCFYFITDKEHNLMEINSGNLPDRITESDVRKFTDSKKDIFKIDDTEYRHSIAETDDKIIHTFMYYSQAVSNSRKLLIMSVVSGGAVFVLVLVLIYLVSGKAVKPIRKSYEKQSEFISNASHELKTPITVISATTELMEKKNGPDRLISCVQAQSQKMSRLVNEMLVLTRLSDKKKLPEQFSRFDISGIVRNSVLYFESRAFEEGKGIVSEIEDNLSYNGDQDKIDQVVGILLDNALKYSDDNSQIKLTLRQEKGIVLTCENLCENFDAGDIPHLFERFYRADKSHSNKKEGFGLGLSIAREIVLAHGGSIDVEYKDKTVRFIVLLPQ